MLLKGVILIGGNVKGTRFRPLSLERPKPLFPIAGVPTLQHHVERLSAVPGLKEILIIGFYQPADIAPFVNDLQRSMPGLAIRYLQEFAPLGTAGGLHHFRDLIQLGDPEAVFVINSDVCGELPLEEMAAFRRERAPEAACLILTTEATREQSLNYGCLVVEPSSCRVEHYVEKPATYVSHHINCGIYLLSPAIFPRLAAVFARKAMNNSGGEVGEAAETIWFERDIFPTIAGSPDFVAFQTTRWWSQIKTAAAAIYANRHCLSLYRKTHPERLFKGESGHIRGDVFVHPTARVDPSAVIGPNVSIGKDAVVGEGVRIRESIILEGATVNEHACILYSIIDRESVVGAWSRVEGTPTGPNPNMPFAKLEMKALFLPDGRLNPAITILGRSVSVAPEAIILNSIVLPHKDLSASYKNQIIL